MPYRQQQKPSEAARAFSKNMATHMRNGDATEIEDDGKPSASEGAKRPN